MRHIKPWAIVLALLILCSCSSGMDDLASSNSILASSNDDSISTIPPYWARAFYQNDFSYNSIAEFSDKVVENGIGELYKPIRSEEEIPEGMDEARINNIKSLCKNAIYEVWLKGETPVPCEVVDFEVHLGHEYVGGPGDRYIEYYIRYVKDPKRGRCVSYLKFFDATSFDNDNWDDFANSLRTKEFSKTYIQFNQEQMECLVHGSYNAETKQWETNRYQLYLKYSDDLVVYFDFVPGVPEYKQEELGTYDSLPCLEPNFLNTISDYFLLKKVDINIE